MKNATTKENYALYLVIGLNKESGHWDQVFLEEMKKNFQTDKLHFLDLPGAGTWLDGEMPWSITEAVKKMRQHYRMKFQPNEKRILIALSLGGMAASEWVKQAPQDFDGFVIVNSSFKTYSPLLKRVQPYAMKKFIQIFLAKTIEEKEKFITTLSCNNEEGIKRVYERWVKLGKERALSDKNLVRQTFAGATYKNKFIPNIPTLVIAAKHDRLAHYTCSEKLKEAWGAQYYLFDNPKIGHAIHVDAPVEFAEVIYNWTQNDDSLKREC
jgi:pimeloyl-[acyl-carrier protein] methyl ester esterase